MEWQLLAERSPSCNFKSRFNLTGIARLNLVSYILEMIPPLVRDKTLRIIVIL